MKLLAGLAMLVGVLPSLGFSCELKDVNYSVFKDSNHIDFVQTKEIQALSRPLVSSGKIWLSPNDELVWQTLVPIKSTLVISASGLRQYNKNDILQTEISLPVAQDLANIFLSILSSDFAALEQSFETSLHCNDNSWQLALKPFESEIENFLTSISIEGSDILQVIAFQEKRGDHTEIKLSEPMPDNNLNFRVYLEE